RAGRTDPQRASLRFETSGEAYTLMGATERVGWLPAAGSSDTELAVPSELALYSDEPPQMRSGTVGKSGYLRLGFERRGDRTILADLYSRTPYLAQRALHCDEALPDMAWLFMINTTRSEEHTSELQSRFDLVCRLLLDK